MKRLLLLALLLPLTAYAEQRTVQQYGVAATVEFELYAADGTLSVAEADSGTEVTIVCDGDAGTTATNDFVDEGFQYSLVLTAAELECKHSTLNVAATLNHAVIIETCGTPNAQHMQCGGGQYISGGTGPAGTYSTTQTILAAAEAYADDVLIGDAIAIVEDTGIGQIACITDNVLTGDVVTHTAFATAAASGSEYILIPDFCQSVTVDSNGNVSANTVLIEGADATDTIQGELVTYDGPTDAEMIARTTTTAAYATATAQTTAQDDLDIITGTTGVNLEADSITAAVIASNAIGSTEIAADAIGSSELAPNSIGALQIATDAIGAAEIAQDAIGALEIASDAIGYLEIGTDAIGALELATDAIGADQIAADAVDEIWNEIIETAGSTYTARCAQAISLAYAAGTWSTSGAVSTFKDPSGASNRLVGTITASTRGSITITCP